MVQDGPPFQSSTVSTSSVVANLNPAGATGGGVEQLLRQQQHLAPAPTVTLNTVSTRPASSFAFRYRCAAAKSSRTCSSSSRIRRA